MLGALDLSDETAIATYEKGRRKTLTFTRRYKNKNGQVSTSRVKESYEYDVRNGINHITQKVETQKAKQTPIPYLTLPLPKRYY